MQQEFWKIWKKRETGILTILWNKIILQQINITSKNVQSSTENLFPVVLLYKSLTNFIQYVRKHFDEYESEFIGLLNKKLSIGV